MTNPGQNQTGEGTNNFTVPPFLKNISIQISSAVNPEDLKPSAATRREQFLESYARHMDQLQNASEGFRAIQELLAGDVTRDICLSDSGREGLSHIVGLLADESENAWGSLPQPDHMRAMLEGASHE